MDTNNRKIIEPGWELFAFWSIKIMLVLIGIGVFIALWIFITLDQIKQERLVKIHRYQQLRKDIEIMPQYKKWRQSVFEKCGRRCAFCGSIQNLQVHHRVSFFSILRQNNIDSIEQASLCYELWNINNGKILCKECHDKTESSRNRQALNK